MTVKITISLPDEVAAAVHDMVRRGHATSFSAFVAMAIAEQLDPITPEQIEAMDTAIRGPIPPEIHRQALLDMQRVGLIPADEEIPGDES